MAIISIYLVINLLFVALLFKRQRVLSYVGFAELLLLVVVWVFTVDLTADFATRLFGEEVYFSLNEAFSAVLGDGYLTQSTLLLIQVAIIVMICYLTFHTVRYISEKISGKRQVEHVADNYKKNCTVSSFDKTATNKIFILHCRLNN